MRSIYAFFRLFNTINAIMKGPAAVARRKARKAGTRATRKVVD